MLKKSCEITSIIVTKAFIGSLLLLGIALYSITAFVALVAILGIIFIVLCGAIPGVIAAGCFILAGDLHDKIKKDEKSDW